MTLTQSPAPGTILDISIPPSNVAIYGVDQSGNPSNTLYVPIVLLDTVAPILRWPEGQIAMGEKQLNDVYKVWEAGVKVYGIAHWIYDQSWTQGLPFADTTAIMYGLHRFSHEIVLSDEEYEEYEQIKNGLK